MEETQIEISKKKQESKEKSKTTRIKNNMYLNNKRGITLIALVVTIVVMLILAGITIQTAIGDGGIINLANEAKEQQIIASYKDRIGIVGVNWSLNRALDDSVTVDDLWQDMQDAKIINNKETDVEKVDENGNYIITVPEGYKFQIHINEYDDLEIDYIGKEDNLLPYINEIKVINQTSNSVELQVSVSRLNNGTLNYYYKEKDAPDEDYQLVKGDTTDLTAIITGLNNKTTYEIKVEATNENGTTEKVTEVFIGELKGTVTQKGETVWSNGTATIELETTETGVTIQYQIDGVEGQWLDYKGPITGLHHGETVYAVTTDGNNQSGYTSIDIVDEVKPQDATINLSTTTAKENETITATVTHTDNESGVNITNCKWVYNTTGTPIGTEEGSYTGGNFSSNGETINLTASVAGTYYLHVLTIDVAGNKIETISKAVTVEKGKTFIEDITTIQKDNTKAEDKYGNIVIVPKGFKVVISEGTTVPEGIVIEDSNHNQFVWIPTGSYKVDESGTTKTNDLTRREWGTTKDVVKEPTPITGDDEASGRFGNIYFGEGDSRSIAHDSIGKFLDSAKPASEGGNGGFYIGRYEQGKGNVCKAGVNAYVSITRDTAKAQAEAMYKDKEKYGVTSELISSYAWDTALNFICQNSKHGYKLATTTSDTYGNIGTGSVGQRVTGNYPADCYSNIYDFLGNCYEWTTEYSSDAPCVIRGGCYYEGGFYAASRKCDSIKTSTSFYSFRLTLYIY